MAGSIDGGYHDDYSDGGQGDGHEYRYKSAELRRWKSFPSSRHQSLITTANVADMSHPLFVLPSDAGGWTTSNTVQTPFVDSSKPPVYEQAVHPGPSAPQPVVAQMSAEQQNAFALFMQQQQQPAAAKNTPLLFGQQPVAPQALVQLQPPVVQQQICQSQYQQPQATTYAAASPLPQLPVQASSFAVPAPRAAPAQQVASSGVDDGLYSRDAILVSRQRPMRGCLE